MQHHLEKQTALKIHAKIFKLNSLMKVQRSHSFAE